MHRRPILLMGFALVPKWRNWQTRRTQNPVPFTRGEGSIPSFGTTVLQVLCPQSHSLAGPVDGVGLPDLLRFCYAQPWPRLFGFICDSLQVVALLARDYVLVHVHRETWGSVPEPL